MRSYSDNAVSKEQFEALEKVATSVYANQEYVKRQAKVSTTLAYFAVILSAISLGISIYSVLN